jgi:O-antigen/teichoic acid export membrane protein
MINKTAYLWGMITKILPSVIQVLTNIILARLLTPSDFGTIGVLNVFFLVANVLIESGLGGSLVKEKQISKIDCSTIGTFSLLISIVIYILLFVFAPIIEGYFDILGLTRVVRVVSISFIISAFGIVPHALLTRDMKFKSLFYITIASVSISSLLAIFLASRNFGVYSLVAYQLGLVFFSAILSIMQSEYYYVPVFSRDSFKRLFSFGFYTTITSVIDTVYENLLAMLIGKHLGIVQAGYLTQAKKLEEGMTTSISRALANVSFPVMTKIKDNREEFIKEAYLLIENVIKYLFPILIFTIILAEEIIVILLGPEWLDSVIYFKLLMWAGLTMIIESIVRSYIKSLCKVKPLMNLTFIKRSFGILILVFCVVLNKEFLVYGYIIGSILALLLNSFYYASVVAIRITDFFTFLFCKMWFFIVVFVFFVYVKPFIANEIIYFLIVSLILIIYYAYVSMPYLKRIYNTCKNVN